MMSPDGFEPLPPQQFWELVAQKKSETSSLEERLLIAQAEGLSANLRRQLAFVGPEAIFEFQALGVKRYANDAYDRSKAAHARNADEAVALCADADQWLAHGIYLMPARLRAGVETRHASPGRWYDIPKSHGTTDSDVEARLILAVDFDVKRPSATSATEEEMQRSVRVAGNAWNYLAHHLGESSLAYLHSGNGRQIHIALDAIPADDVSKNALAGLLTGLAHLFNTAEVSVDEKLFDAKRILPACGTLKKKGTGDSAERPHRRTAIVTPENPTRVPLEKIIELARTLWDAADANGRTAIESSFGIRPRSTTNVLTAPRNPGSPFDIVNAVDPQTVVEWLGLYNAGGEIVCPGCGETSGVAVLNRGLKCHHNRCKDRGRNGFRSNVDLVAEVHRVAPREAVSEISDRFNLNLPAPSPPAPEKSYSEEWLPPLGERLADSVIRAERRANGVETPVPLPWDLLNPHFGGGLWPGLHVICSTTGSGKTALVLQVCKHSAEQDVPVAYVGLEMDDLQFDLRVVAEHAKAKWSDLYTGQADEKTLAYARGAALEIIQKNLPLHPINRNPMSWPASKIRLLATAMREKYPEQNGPGSRPLLIVLDYLQIVGPEESEDGKYKTLDLRERIGRAAYALREAATSFNISILIVASIARDKYGLWPMMLSAELQGSFNGKEIVDRRITSPDALVGLGKESGEIEYSADSVSVLSRVPGTFVEGVGDSVVFATAKGRATGARWSPMHFTGYRYEPSRDGGSSVMTEIEKTSRVKEQKKLQKEEERRQEEEATTQKKNATLSAREQQRARDRDVCLRIITQTPGIGTRDLRTRMTDELGGCSRERTEEAVFYCEKNSYIKVDRINPKALRHYPSTDREMCVMGDQKSPRTPLVGAPHAPHGGVANSESATRATRDLSHGKDNGERVAEASATRATPAQNGKDATELHEKRAKARGWGSERTASPGELARAKDDWKTLQKVAMDGDDPRAWATEQGWDKDRIRFAETCGGPT